MTSIRQAQRGRGLPLGNRCPLPLFRLRNAASGPEIVNCWGLSGPHPTAKPLEKGERIRPHRFQRGFAVGENRLDPNNRRFSARKLYCVTAQPKVQSFGCKTSLNTEAHRNITNPKTQRQETKGTHRQRHELKVPGPTYTPKPSLRYPWILDPAAFP